MENLKTLIDQQLISNVLKRNSPDRNSVASFQEALYELGFGKELNWEKFGADGGFGDSTSSALKTFAEKNNLSTDGESVTPELGRLLLEKLIIVRSLRFIHRLKETGELEAKLKRGSNQASAVKALQHLLYHLGYATHLNWEKFGADGDYGSGTTLALQAYAAREGINSDGSAMTAELAERMIRHFSASLGDGWAAVKTSSTPGVQTASLPNVFKRYKLGVYTVGRHSPANFIEKNPEQLRKLGLTDSLLRIISAVSRNEGNLEAINTWDNSYLTFGMFQWTIGQDRNKGELAAMMNKVKRQAPDIFDEHLGRYGLDISIADTGNVTGHFKLQDKVVDHPRQKEQLRGDDWAVRFWQAGQTQEVQAIQIQHAASRLWTFFWKEPGNGYALSQLVSSEFGVALLLDNHVNRPGYVRACIDRALVQTGLKDPENWDSEDEAKLLRAYLDIRKTHGKYPMTHAKERGDKMIDLRNGGLLNAERGSFVFDEKISRGGLFGGPAQPSGYRHEDYPEIEWDESMIRQED